MNEAQMLFPIMAHILLVVGLYVLLGSKKAAAFKSKSVDLKAASLDNSAWPQGVVQVSNNLANQFESPMLFYAVCFITHLTGMTNIFAVSLAWLYVALRFFHAYIHTGSNYVPYRFRSFLLSIFVIVALLIQTTVQLMLK